METRGLVDALCKKHGTRDPFEIARQRDIIVIDEPLGGIYGFYSKSHRQKFIHINQTLNEQVQHFICCHELGHAIMHPDLNTPFLRAATLFSVDKLEFQANCFAVDLAFDDSQLWPFLSRPITDAAAYMGVNIRLAEYRMRSVQPKLWGDFSEA